MHFTHAELQKQYRDAYERDQKSGGCSKEQLKIRDIQQPRKSTSVAYFFDNVYNRNVRDVDKYLHVTVSINIYIYILFLYWQNIWLDLL